MGLLRNGLDIISESMEIDSEKISVAVAMNKASEVKSQSVDQLLEKMPPELVPFKSALKALSEGDVVEAGIKVAGKLLPLIGIALLIIIVGFCIKWWVGLLAIPVAIGWLVYRVLLILNGLRKFAKSLPANALGLIDEFI